MLFYSFNAIMLLAGQKKGCLARKKLRQQFPKVYFWGPD